MQVLVGPRQVGKTTLARQVIEVAGLPAHYASADEPTLRDQAWLEQQWDQARIKARNHPDGALLVIDEIQKAARWPEVVKRLWDADSHDATPLKLVLLGSSPLTAIEVKSGGRKGTLPGIAVFDKTHHPTAKLLVGGQGIPIAEFLQAPASHWLADNLFVKGEGLSPKARRELRGHSPLSLGLQRGWA